MSEAPTELPRSLLVNPRLEQWLVVRGDDGVTVFTGKVELGQGILTALAQIAAEELCLSLELIEIVSGQTDRCPEEWYTAGSQSVEVGGAAVRLACAHAMRLLSDAGRERLGDGIRALGDGRFAAPSGSEVGYSELASAVDWSAEVRLGQARPVGEYRVVGRPVPRLDLARALAGGGFVHDLELPGILHGRVLRGAEPNRLDGAGLEALPGVAAVVRDGRFAGLVAEREEQAVAARATVMGSATGRADGTRSSITQLRESTSILLRTQQIGSPELAPRVATTHRAVYTRPFLAHAAIGPSCAVARMEPGGASLTMWSHSQGVFALRDQVARTLGLEPSGVSVVHVPGAGCYGHNGADDVALDAALLARAVPGRPVRVVWSREDELRHAPAGSGMVVELEAGLTASGRVASWQLDVTSGSHLRRPGSGEGVDLLAAGELAKPLPASQPADVPPEGGGGGDRNALALYDFPHQQIRYHLVPELPVRTSALRTLGAFANVFAIESFMDELALETFSDPVAFRLAHLDDSRARAVISEAARLADWEARRAPGDEQTGSGTETGLGIGFARYKNTSAYTAIVAETEAEHDVRVRRVWCAVDAGLVINPDGLRNQVEGGIVQATSWTLKEQLGFDQDGVCASSWQEYPLLRFSETPEIEISVLDQPCQPPLGIGEALAGPTAAAIANAVADALDLRARELPLTRDSLTRAIGA